MRSHLIDPSSATQLRQHLLDLARRQESLACDEAAATPYWSPTPTSVLAHRAAARALRTEADLLLQSH